MTIECIQAEKEKLRQAFRDAIDDFGKATGLLPIVSIDHEIIEKASVHGTFKSTKIKIDIKVEI